MIYAFLFNSLDLISQVINSDNIILSSTLFTSIKGLFKGKIKQEYTYKSDITREEYEQIYNSTFGSVLNKSDEDFELITNTNIDSNLAINDLNVNNTWSDSQVLSYLIKTKVEDSKEYLDNTLVKLLANDSEYLESKIDINNSTGLEKLVKFINFKLNYGNDSFNISNKQNKTLNDLLGESFDVEQLVENTIDNLDGNENLLKELQDLFNVSLSLSIFALPKTIVNKIKDLFNKKSNIREVDEETINDIWDNNSNQNHMRRWKTYEVGEENKTIYIMVGL